MLYHDQNIYGCNYNLLFTFTTLKHHFYTSILATCYHKTDMLLGFKFHTKENHNSNILAKAPRLDSAAMATGLNTTKP